MKMAVQTTTSVHHFFSMAARCARFRRPANRIGRRRRRARRQAARVPPTLHGERVVLRPAAGADAEALARLFAEPAVARWWGSDYQDVARVREELVGSGAGWVIEIDGAVAGWLEYAEETEPMYRHVGLDIALATARHGAGYGREALRVAIRHFSARGHHRFTIDPAAANERAIRSYAALGFRPVGRQRAADGSWRDGLLMDLLAHELREAP
jgi:aminoglycoside 6'-N-acetyltransferase